MSINIKNLTKFYGKHKALDNVSLTIKKGEIVGFLGPNGAGKSTLMKILTTYLPFNDGVVEVNGYNVEEQPIETKKSIGYLPENNPLYLEMYVREYLDFHAKIFSVSMEEVERMIELTKLTAEANKKIGQLSKGYRQRVGLAAALLHNPEVLILDEPTTGLDPNQLVEIRALIKEIAKDKTIFLSTHIMQEVEAICDRVIIIKKGKIIEDFVIGANEEQQQVIEVEFDFKLEPQFINKIPHVSFSENVHDTIWLLHFDTQEDMRVKLFDFAQEMGVKILSMQRKNKKLEALFVEKTNE